MFGGAIGNELEVRDTIYLLVKQTSATCVMHSVRLQLTLLSSVLLLHKYLSFSPTSSPFSVRGYVALIQDSWEVSPSGLKQARAYYQFVFFQNRWVESFHQECAKHITQLALDSNLGQCSRSHFCFVAEESDAS